MVEEVDHLNFGNGRGGAKLPLQERHHQQHHHNPIDNITITINNIIINIDIINDINIIVIIIVIVITSSSSSS